MITYATITLLTGESETYVILFCSNVLTASCKLQIVQNDHSTAVAFICLISTSFTFQFQIQYLRDLSTSTNAVFHIQHYSTLINHVHKAHRFIERVSTTRPAVLYLTIRGGTKLLARPYAKQYASRTRTSRRPKCHRLGPECNHSPPSKMLINGTNKHTQK